MPQEVIFIHIKPKNAQRIFLQEGHSQGISKQVSEVEKSEKLTLRISVRD